MNIVFVCTGNTCRSPMAEGFMKKLSMEKGCKINIISRGISVREKAQASPLAKEAVKQYGVDISSHLSSPLTSDDIENADLILTMQSSQSSLIRNVLPNLKDKVFSFSEYGCGDEICDPYGGDENTYRQCAEQIYKSVNKLLDKITGKDNDKI